MIYKVMLLDDEPWQLKGMKEMIPWDSTGFKVTYTLENPADALLFLSSEKIDVLLTDIRMPGLSGLELMERLRQNNVDTEVIFLSGYAEFSYAQEALRMGAYDYLLKPFNLEEMPSFLEQLRLFLDKKADIASLILQDRIENKITGEIQSDGEKLIKAMMEYIEIHYAAPLSLKELARNCNTNATTTERLFRKYLETTFIRHLTRVRIKKACALLRGGNNSIEEICSQVGYEDYFYFNKVFKKETGFTPYRYRKDKSNPGSQNGKK
jgi:two-component system response regulator YesN